MRDQTRTLNAEAEAFDPVLRAGSIARLEFGTTHLVGPKKRLTIGLHATLDTAVSSFVYQSSDTQTVVLDPWILRPGIGLRIGRAFDWTPGQKPKPPKREAQAAPAAGPDA